jgi:hypothetical protein
MGSMGLLVVAVHEGDLQVLQRGYVEHLRQAAMGSPVLQRMLQQRQRQR